MGSTGPPDFWLCLSIHPGWPLQYHGALPKTLEVWCSYWVIYVMYPNLNWFHGCYQSPGNIRTMSNNQWVEGGTYQHCSILNSHHQKPNKYRAHHLAVGLWINPIPRDLDANKCCTCCLCDPDKEVILLRVLFWKTSTWKRNGTWKKTCFLWLKALKKTTVFISSIHWLRSKKFHCAGTASFGRSAGEFLPGLRRSTFQLGEGFHKSCPHITIDVNMTMVIMTCMIWVSGILLPF